MKNNYAALQKTWTISVQAIRSGFLFQVLPSDRIFVWDFFNWVLPSDPVIVSNVGFTKYLPSMFINPITRPSRQDDLFPGTTQSVASIDVFIVFLVDVPENKKGVLRCATTTWTGLRSLARRMGSLLDFTPCSPLSTC